MTLTLTTLRSLGSFAHALRDAAGTATHNLQILLEARRNRRAITSLADFDERMLKDIGLSRSEVVGALEVGFDQDPSSVLVRDTTHAPGAHVVRRVEASAPGHRASFVPQGFAQGIA